MSNIIIYDTDYTEIEEICERNNTTPAEVVEVLLNIVKDEEIDLNEYF
jgi:chorismate mutase